MSAVPAEDTVPTSQPLLLNLHAAFIHKLDSKKDSIHYWTAQHLKVSGMYWGLGAMQIMKRHNELDAVQLKAFCLACQNADGGFGGSPGQDSHLLYTLSALQVLAQIGALDACAKTEAAEWIASRQQPDGSFAGDPWGEIDSRFVYIALNALQLLRQLHKVDVEKAVSWTLSCQNWDGGFGVAPGAESHAGQVFCCVGALCIANAISRINQDKLGLWLAMRQLPSGGLNGRPEKKADVCYSWWVISSLCMLKRHHWIDREALFRYILQCQDAEDGGIADKPSNQPDVYHTFFGLCGLTLLGYSGAELNQINPVYAMPYEVLNALGIEVERGRDVGRR